MGRKYQEEISQFLEDLAKAVEYIPVATKLETQLRCLIN